MVNIDNFSFNIKAIIHYLDMSYNERYALNPVFWKRDAIYSHLSGGRSFWSFFQLGHFDLLHTALSDSYVYKRES